MMSRRHEGTGALAGLSGVLAALPRRRNCRRSRLHRFDPIATFSGPPIMAGRVRRLLLKRGDRRLLVSGPSRRCTAELSGKSMDPGRGLIIAVLIVVVICAPIWAAVQNHRNPNARPRLGWPVFIVIAILLVTVFIATLL
jgi:hypothetical protein